MVVDVRVDGNKAVPLHRIAPHIQTRAGRAYSTDVVEEDVRRLTKSRMFVNVNTTYQRVPEGVVVVFQVVERPTLAYVKYLGSTLKRSTLEKNSGIKVGDSIDPYMVDEARRKLEEHYKSKGFSKARVVTLEGNKPGDRGAVFKITEGPKLKIYDIEFEGNTIADDGRLKTQIGSRPPILYLFKGEVDYDKIDEDVNKLTAYYRGLGFFGAKIGREIEFDEGSRWATLRFVINEGQRYKVRNVSILGNKQFETTVLDEKLKLKNGLFFDQGAMVRDISSLQDHYGAIGYVFCNVQADPRFLEEPGELDLVYQIEEGDRYRVGRVNVRIEGDDPHTRINTVLNRVELRPGDIVDTRKIRDSERRLKASGLFKNDPATGTVPKITWEVPEGDDILTAEKDKGGTARGQSPDNASPRPPMVYSIPQVDVQGDRVLDVTIDGTLEAEQQPTPVWQRGPIPFSAPNAEGARPQPARPPLFAPLNETSLDGNPYWTGRRRYAANPPQEWMTVAQVGAQSFARAADSYVTQFVPSEAAAPSQELPTQFVGSPAPWASGEPSAFDQYAQQALDQEGLVVSGQSPLQGSPYGSTPSYGQMPLGATSPGTAAASTYPPAGTIPTQYTTPAPGYSSAPAAPQPPTYGTPTYSYPGNTTPPQNYGAAGPLAPVPQQSFAGQGTPYAPPAIGAEPRPTGTRAATTSSIRIPRPCSGRWSRPLAI
ncbi:MAG: POTRA domain-containing protein [Pirellulales bacterium]